MTLWQLALLAKEMEKLSDDGLNSISVLPNPYVNLEERAFMELFPCCWHEEETQNPKFKRRSIRIDGVEYSTLVEVK